MAAFAPFEPAPEIAVAVSGGPDSLALAVLLADWVRGQGGRLLAVTVDHGLRAEAAQEARLVARVMAGLGVDHRTVTWAGARPPRVRQDHARSERFARLRAVCQAEGILHLALGHQREDRAETVLLRIQAGSRLDGLAGMAAEREMPELRLLRPLIAVPKARLEATLTARGLAWVEDPSNRDPGYRRVRVRSTLPELARQGLTVGRINAFAQAVGIARRTVESAQNALLARAVELHPAGFARLDPEAFADARSLVAEGALARVLLAVGGGIYPPRGGRLERLGAALRGGLKAARTLGGCQVIPWRGQLLIVREWERAAALTLEPGQAGVADGRFEVAVAAGAPEPLTVAPLGRSGWAQLTQADPRLKTCALPGPVRPALAGVFDSRGLVFLPALPYVERVGVGWLADWRFAPRRPLTGGGFTVAQDEAHTMS